VAVAGGGAGGGDARDKTRQGEGAENLPLEKLSDTYPT
jgi:hypothetical protein